MHDTPEAAPIWYFGMCPFQLQCYQCIPSVLERKNSFGFCTVYYDASGLYEPGLRRKFSRLQNQLVSVVEEQRH